MPEVRALPSVRNLEQGLIIALASHQLQADRQALGKAAGQRNPWQPGRIGERREHGVAPRADAVSRHWHAA